MNSNRFLGVLFCLAICFQLFCNNFTPVENNTEVMKTDSICSGNSMCSGILEQTQNVEQKNANV